MISFLGSFPREISNMNWRVNREACFGLSSRVCITALRCLNTPTWGNSTFRTLTDWSTLLQTSLLVRPFFLQWWTRPLEMCTPPLVSTSPPNMSCGFRFVGDDSHRTTLTCSSESWRLWLNDPNRTTSSGRKRDEILTPPNQIPSALRLHLEYLSIQIIKSQWHSSP